MTAPKPPAKRRRSGSVTTTVEVDIDLGGLGDELEAAGWHHEDDCWSDVDDEPPTEPVPDLREAVASLHRQAHPSEHRDPFMCREEPCRSIPARPLVPHLGVR